MKEIDPSQLLVIISQILTKLNIPYFVTGGMAVLIWGRPRFTADIDMVIGLKLDKLDNLKKALSSLGKAVYIDKDSMLRALKNYGEFNFIHGDSGMKVDFWVLKNNPFETSCLKRKIKKRILKKFVDFITAEDLIISKLKWYQKTPSDRQIEDIQSVLKISGKKIDREYLKLWIEKLQLEEIWTQKVFNKTML